MMTSEDQLQKVPYSKWDNVENLYDSSGTRRRKQWPEWIPENDCRGTSYHPFDPRVAGLAQASPKTICLNKEEDPRREPKSSRLGSASTGQKYLCQSMPGGRLWGRYPSRENFYSNWNLTMLDVLSDCTGNNSIIGPNRQFWLPPSTGHAGNVI